MGNSTDEIIKTYQESSIQYDGKVGQIYKIFLLNIILGILTLGIYHFWGKTRQRRYVTSSFSFKGDRFSYIGEGKELFFGFIKVLVILGIVCIPLIWAIIENEKIENHLSAIVQEQTQVTEEQDHKSLAPLKEIFNKLSPQERREFIIHLAIIYGYFAVFIFILPYIAAYATWRYRATRLTWRGIRGALKGSMFVYGLIGALQLILLIFTCGLLIPVSDMLLNNYKLNRLHFGTQKGRFLVKYGPLFISHFKTYLVCIALLFMPILVYLIFSGNPGQIKIENLPPEHAQNALYALVGFCMVISILLCMLVRVWYRAALARVIYNNLSFGNIQFASDITGLSLCGLLIGNLLIMTFTLGLGYPIVLQRKMRYFAKHVKITGDVDALQLSQAQEKLSKTGEGLGTTFDIQINLF